MPELPEAETIARTLAPYVEGRRIIAARFPGKRVWRSGPPPRLEGSAIRRVRRQGKRIVIELDSGILTVRLGMTGALLAGAAPGPHTRAILDLDHGVLLFDDIRQFGWLTFTDAPAAGIGPDPLEISAGEFAALLRTRRGAVKPLLLNQAFLAGLGNIYTDEALFRAGIHPLTLAVRLSRAKAEALHRAMVAVLQEAIQDGGSSISDYVNAEGQKGQFQLRHQVYGKEGQPCPRCGAKIRRIVVGQRGTHLCPRCQRYSGA